MKFCQNDIAKLSGHLPTQFRLNTAGAKEQGGKEALITFEFLFSFMISFNVYHQIARNRTTKITF